MNQKTATIRNHKLPSRNALIYAAVAMVVAQLFSLISWASDDVSPILYILSLCGIALAFSVLARWFSYRSNSLGPWGLILILLSEALGTGLIIGGEVVMNDMEEATSVLELIDTASYFAYFFSASKVVATILHFLNMIGIAMIAISLWPLRNLRNGSWYKALTFLSCGAALYNLICCIYCLLLDTSDLVAISLIEESANVVDLLDILIFMSIFSGIACVGATSLNRSTIAANEITAPIANPVKPTLRYFASAFVVAVAGILLGLFNMPWWGLIILGLFTGGLLFIIIEGTKDDDLEETEEEMAEIEDTPSNEEQ